MILGYISQNDTPVLVSAVPEASGLDHASSESGDVQLVLSSSPQLERSCETLVARDEVQEQTSCTNSTENHEKQTDKEGSHMGSGTT